MKLFYILIFLVFSSVSFQVQGQGFIPGPSLEYKFDWSTFINKENIQKRIEFRNQSFKYFGLIDVPYINLAKLDLLRIELTRH